MDIMNITNTSNSRYAYYEIPLNNYEFAQAVNGEAIEDLQKYRPECREMFKDMYCGSFKEEFVARDPAEREYLQRYVDIINTPNDANAQIEMVNPDRYVVHVTNADVDTYVIVKMTYDKDFTANVNGEKLEIDDVGPYFMLLKPGKQGDYDIELAYNVSKTIIIGGITSGVSLLVLIIVFAMIRNKEFNGVRYKRG